MKKTLVIVLATVLLLVMGLAAIAQEADEWSQFQKDPQNSGYFNVPMPSSGTAGKETVNIKAVDGSQPVVAGSRFYVYTHDSAGTGDCFLECYGLGDFQQVWKQKLDPPALGSWSSPAVAGGAAYVCSGSKVYAFNSVDGTKLWARDLATYKANAQVVNSSPSVVENLLFIGDWQNGIYYCLDVNNKGKKVWSFSLDAGCLAQSTPAIDGDHVFVGQVSPFGSEGTKGKLWCLNKSDGAPVNAWGSNGFFRPANNLDVTGSAAVGGDYLYFSDYDFFSPNSNLYCLKKSDGSEVWRGPVLPSSGTPAVGGGIVVSAGQDWGTMTLQTTAFAAGPGSGGAATPAWTAVGFGGWTTSPAVAGGEVAVGVYDPAVPPWGGYKGIGVLDGSDGSVLWHNPNKGGSSPVPTEKGLLSIGDNEVVAFDDTPAPTSEFYFAEGCTRAGYQEWLCLENPTGETIDANIEYMLSDGTTRDQPIALPPQSRTTVDVNLFLGPGCDAAAHVTGNGSFIAERSMYVDTGGISGGEQVIGVTDPASSYLFAEGTTREGFQTWLALQNPGTEDADIIITYLYGDGSPPLPQNVSVGAMTRQTVDVNMNAGPGEDVSIAVTSNRDIIGERVMYFTAPGEILGSQPTGVHNSTGVKDAGTSWYFAEGTTRYNFQEWLCLMNPRGDNTTAHVSYMLSDGTNRVEDKVLTANSRTTVNVNEEVGEGNDVSMLVTADSPIVAERPIYFQYDPGLDGVLWGGGHDTAGAAYAAYKWEFAEGTTRSGFATYLCLANPNNQGVDVEIDYITAMDDGTKETVTQTVTMERSSRYTIDVNAAVGTDRDVSMVVTCDVPIVAERPMYFGTSSPTGGGTSLGFPGSL